MSQPKSALLAIVILLGALPAIAQTQPDKTTWMKANGSYDAANFLFKQKKYKEAEEKYREAITLYPGDWHYHYNLALALKHAGKGNEAVTEFRKTLELNEKDWRSWKALGNTYYRLKQFAEAKDAFENGIKYGAPPADVAEMRKGIAACTGR
jgi:Flp pilus assembly protein TadD